MARFYEAIADELAEFIRRQHVFFVAQRAAGCKRARQHLAQGDGYVSNPFACSCRLSGSNGKRERNFRAPERKRADYVYVLRV